MEPIGHRCYPNNVVILLMCLELEAQENVILVVIVLNNLIPFAKLSIQHHHIERSPFLSNPKYSTPVQMITLIANSTISSLGNPFER